MKIQICDHCGKDKDDYPQLMGNGMFYFDAEVCSTCYNEAVERTKELRELALNTWDEIKKICNEYEKPTPEFLERLKEFGQVPQHANLIQ